MQNMQRQQNISYRRKRYRRRRIRNIIIVIAATLAVLFVIFLILGNILNNKVNGDGEPEGTAPEAAEAAEHFDPREISCYPVTLSSFSASLNAIPEGGGAGIMLTDKEGNPLYRTAISSLTGGKTSASDLASSAKSRDRYCCGIIYCAPFSEENDLDRASRLGTLAALSAEVSRGGFDEILLLCHSAGEENIGEIISLIGEIKRLNGDAVIGISLPLSFYTSENSTVNVATLWDSADFLGVDLTSIPPEELDAAVGSINYYLIRYKVRALIPETADEELNTQTAEVIKNHGTSNFQKIIVE